MGCGASSPAPEVHIPGHGPRPPRRQRPPPAAAAAVRVSPEAQRASVDAYLAATSGGGGGVAGANVGSAVGGGYGGSAGGGGERVVTHAELERHCTRASAWVAIDGEVYDITRFADRHPGGVTAILGQAGRDGSEAFRLSHAPYIDVRERLADCRVGRLSG